MKRIRGGCSVSALVISVLLVLTVSAEARSQQDSTATWDTGALRVHRSIFSARLVRGVNGEKVARLGMFAPKLSLFAEMSDSAGRHYSAYRSRQNTGTIAQLVGLGVLVLGAVAASKSQDATGPALVTGGLTLGAVGMVYAATGYNELSQAVWWYNRGLVAAGRAHDRD
ncbi:MAG TPA: hypothetical protein VGA37_02735 [Gemmatimonadales bacterium]